MDLSSTRGTAVGAERNIEDGCESSVMGTGGGVTPNALQLPISEVPQITLLPGHRTIIMNER